MSSIAAVSPASQVGATTASGSSRIPQKALGQSDFLKLLSVQLQQQDPMKPMEDTSFMAPMRCPMSQPPRLSAEMSVDVQASALQLRWISCQRAWMAGSLSD